jgi:hypothetical protein
MKKVIFISILFISSQLLSQSNLIKDSIPALQIKLLNTNYKDFVVVGKLIYAITKGDSLIAINFENNKINFYQNNIKCLIKTKKNEIFVLNDSGDVLLKKNDLFLVVDKFEGNPHKILTDDKDNIVVISSKYVRYKNKNYAPKINNKFFKIIGKSFKSSVLSLADVYFVDDKNRIWFGYDSGEWGGKICFFDLNKEIFFDDTSLSSDFDDKYDRWPKNDYELFREYPNKVKIINGDTIFKFPHNLDLSNIKGVSQNKNGDFYITTSLMHFSIESNLSKFNKTKEVGYYLKQNISNVLEHKVYEEKKEKYYDNDGNINTLNVPRRLESLEYLGSVTFNPFNKHIYYYTNNGFWKLIENKSNISKEFVFKPWINWVAGLPNSVGYQMNVTKFEFISEKEIVFITSINGIGYFDGKSVKYFK